MRFGDIVRVAFRALRKNKLRATLTVLGVVIGIAAVTAMVSLGQSASGLVQAQLQTLGTNVIIVLPASGFGHGVREGAVTTLTGEDANAITERCPSVFVTSPTVNTTGQVICGNVNWSPSEMQGVGPDHLALRNWRLLSGAFFSRTDVTAGAKVCVLGLTVGRELFQLRNPIGQQIRVKNVPFRVIGVLEPKGANMFGQDQDDVLLMPYTTVMKRIQGSQFNNVNAILVLARSSELMAQAENEIRALLRDRHRLRSTDPSDFQVRNTTEIANVMRATTLTLTVMLSSIAAISLLVGGVGIMNIMLVSVTERTREIGIRMAVGAQPRDILRQFLVESVVLASIGGMLGVAFGAGSSSAIVFAINAFLPGSDWPLIISLPAAAVAMVFSGLVGIFFGYYPALRASRLDPIEALRYE